MMGCTRTYKGTVTVTYNGDELGMATRVVAIVERPIRYSPARNQTTGTRTIPQAKASAGKRGARCGAPG